MQSQQAWDFAQRFSIIKMIQVSIALILFGIIDIFAFDGYEFTVYAGLALTILGFIYLIVTTEKELKKRF